jgi:hypothetical protein
VENVTDAGNNGGPAGTGGTAGVAPTAGTAGTGGAAGAGGGVFSQGSATPLQNTLLAFNGGGNCGGVIADGGHNLSFGDGSCAAGFSTGDPNLGPLGDNGGPSQTISLQPGSAAIDKIPASGAGCPATDQRGVPRPAGAGCDIGAYEVAAPKATTQGVSAKKKSSVVLGASVTPNAGYATVQFVWGKTAGYGNATKVQHVSGVTATPLAAKLTGLKLGRRYHYNVIVTAMDGTAKGRDRTFVIRCLRRAKHSKRCLKIG